MSINGVGLVERCSAIDALIALNQTEARELTDSIIGYADRYGCDGEETCSRGQSWATKIQHNKLTVSKSLIDLRLAG